jgi:DNA-binding LacI/PurR family transcriptional regulator
MNNKLKVHSSGEEIKKDILGQIKKGLLKKDDRILPEEKLADLYGLGIKIVRKALTELEAEGIIYRKKRIGTFVKRNISKKINIAVLLFDILDTANAYCREILKGINSSLDPEKCSIQIHPVQSRKIKGGNDSLLQRLIYSGEIDGLLILSWLDVKEVSELLKKSIPFVLSGFEYKNLDAPCIVPNIESAFCKMIDYLVKNEHTDIALMAGHLDAPDSNVLMAEQKMEGIYMKSLEISHLNSCVLKRGMYTVEDGKRMMLELLNGSKPPTAVISHGNELTRGAMEAISEKGLAQGKDIQLIGYIEDAFGFPKPAIRNPVFEVGKRSVEMLFQQIENDCIKVQKELVEPEFIFI